MARPYAAHLAGLNRERCDVEMTVTPWLVAHLVAGTALAAIGWVVQVVVYPAFALVGVAEWAEYHRRHGQAITLVVGPPWVAQAVSVVGLAVVAPSATAVLLGVLALAGVALTVFAAVPAHGRLGAVRAPSGTSGTPGDRTGAAAVDPVQLRRLLRANLWRSLVWSASVLVSATALLTGGLPFAP